MTELLTGGCLKILTSYLMSDKFLKVATLMNDLLEIPTSIDATVKAILQSADERVNRSLT